MTSPDSLLYPNTLKMSRSSQPSIRPLLTDASHQVSDQPAPELNQASKILIVDDNAVNQSITFGQLKTLGYEADQACNGQEAIDVIGTVSQWPAGVLPYALIFMDCNMPVMDGYEATRAIRQLEQQRGNPNKRVVIIALTANVLEADRVRAFSAGMDDYLTKPITIDMLRATLGHWLNVGYSSQPNSRLNFVPKQATSLTSAPISNSVSMSLSTSAQASMFIPSSPSSSASLSVVPGRLASGITEQAMIHLDWDYLHSLSDDDHDFEMTLLELFVEDCQEQLKQLKRAIAHTDLHQVEQVAHYIKGASANVGAQYMQHYAHSIESHVRQTNQLPSFEPLLSQMETSLMIIQDIWSAQR